MAERDKIRELALRLVDSAIGQRSRPYREQEFERILRAALKPLLELA